MLMASTSRVRLPCRGGTLHSTRCGSPPSAATEASTSARVGGTTGSPSVHPCSKYHSVRSVPAGTRIMFCSVICAGLTASCAIHFPITAVGTDRISLSADSHRVLANPEAVQDPRHSARLFTSCEPSESLVVWPNIAQAGRQPGIEVPQHRQRPLG